MHTVIDAPKLLDGDLDHVLHRRLVHNVDLDHDGTKIGILGVRLALLGRRLGLRFVQVGKDDTLDARFSEGEGRLFANSRSSLFSVRRGFDKNSRHLRL